MQKRGALLPRGDAVRLLAGHGLAELALAAFAAGDAVLAGRECGDGRADEMLRTGEVLNKQSVASFSQQPLHKR
jgi:hypothetical protein